MNNRQKTGLYYPIKSKEIREWKGAEKLKNTLKLYFPCYQEKGETKMPSIHSKVSSNVFDFS